MVTPFLFHGLRKASNLHRRSSLRAAAIGGTTYIQWGNVRNCSLENSLP